ncbi:esterase/lipase family protein [Nocardia arizonensis]|uniref:esterase/lipase family protein n=1 Tax=Nocardia arizonensis TaxID=1141647 RepID=UPI0009EB73FF|nr:alpha/beta fold hydrolase [Nocardia arizonensis]
MKRSNPRPFRLRSAAVAATTLGLFVFAWIANAPITHAENDFDAEEQSIADYIHAGLRGGPVGGTGSACASGSGAGSGNGSGNCYGSSGSAAGSSGGFASDTVGHGPPMSVWTTAFAYGLSHPDLAPPGANDWHCEPSPRHPRPVVLLHGTWENAYNNFAYFSQPLADAGFCVFAFNFGRTGLPQGGGVVSVLPGANGNGYIQDSAVQLAGFVDRVLAATGAEEVDIIGHSQGGAMANWYTKFDGGAAKVGHLVSYGATHHGTTALGIGALGRVINNAGIDVIGFAELAVGHAAAQQVIGSDFLTRLNADGDTVPGVDYTVVATRYDQFNTNFDLTFLHPGPDATVRNIVLQDNCEQDLSDHLTMMYSPRALSIALNALDPTGHPDLTCTFNPWLVGGDGHL